MSEDKQVQKIYFEPSTLETIDRSLFEYFEKLNLHTQTNKGKKKVPVVWATSERAFLTKNSKEIRDKQGALIFPVISIQRTSVSKPLASKGIFVGNVPESGPDGGAVSISKVINQARSSAFATADAKSKTGQLNYPRKNKKVVYKTVSIPMPVNVELNYEVTIRTEFQQQMNELMLPFLTTPGTINYISLYHAEHRYEGFIEANLTPGGNISNYTNDERRFETKINIRVVGYVVGQGDNREKPFYSITENTVEIKIPRETVILDPKELEKYF